MKRDIFALIVSSALLFSSCIKEDPAGCTFKDSTASASTAERAFLQAYLASKSITATEHSSGVFYVITRPGTGTITPGVCSNIAVKYSGYLLDGTTAFDSYTGTGGTVMTLGGLVVGWQKGLSVLQKGGAITLYIPPSLGYGSQVIRNGNGEILIPANSNLKFDIELENIL